MNKKNDRIDILGAGSVGLFWASRFREENIPCSLITRPSKSLQQYHTVYLQQQSNYQYQRHLFCPANKMSNKIDTLLVCVKAHQIRSALSPIIHLIHSRTTIILLQNGMGFVEELLLKFPLIRPTQLYIGINSYGVFKKGPYHIIHQGEGRCWVGPSYLYKEQDQLKVPKIIKKLIGKGIFSGYDSNISIRQWKKVVVNAVINPLTAIFQCRNGSLINKDTSDLVNSLIEECCMIAQHQNILIEPKEMLKNVIQVCKATTNNYSSMSQDVLFKRKTEIDYINGYFIKASQNNMLNSVYNNIVTTIIKSLT